MLEEYSSISFLPVSMLLHPDSEVVLFFKEGVKNWDRQFQKYVKMAAVEGRSEVNPIFFLFWPSHEAYIGS